MMFDGYEKEVISDPINRMHEQIDHHETGYDAHPINSLFTSLYYIIDQLMINNVRVFKFIGLFVHN